MSGYLTQVAERASLQFLTATASSDTTPSVGAIKTYLQKIYLVQGLTGFTAFLPVSFLNNFSTQAKADTSGNWLNGVIGTRTDVTGSVYLALLTADPGRQTTLPTMAAVELKATGYSRQPVQFSFATQPTTGGTGASNTGPLFFGPFTGSSGMGVTATHVALVNAASGTNGSCIAVWQLDTPVYASQNENLMLNAAGLAVGLDTWQG
jgi:hypothetical protein